jgi:hypothetical protein
MSQSSDDTKPKTPTVKDTADYLERTTGVRPTHMTHMTYNLPEELIDEFWSHINDETEEQVWKLILKYRDNVDCVTLLSQIFSSVSYNKYIRESEARGWGPPAWREGEAKYIRSPSDLEKRRRGEY